MENRLKVMTVKKKLQELSVFLSIHPGCVKETLVHYQVHNKHCIVDAGKPYETLICLLIRIPGECKFPALSVRWVKVG